MFISFGLQIESLSKFCLFTLAEWREIPHVHLFYRLIFFLFLEPNFLSRVVSLIYKINCRGNHCLVLVFLFFCHYYFCVDLSMFLFMPLPLSRLHFFINKLNHYSKLVFHTGRMKGAGSGNVLNVRYRPNVERQNVKSDCGYMENFGDICSISEVIYTV